MDFQVHRFFDIFRKQRKRGPGRHPDRRRLYRLQRRRKQRSDAVFPAGPSGEREGGCGRQEHSPEPHRLPALRREDDRQRPSGERHGPERVVRLQRQGEREVGRSLGHPALAPRRALAALRCPRIRPRHLHLDRHRPPGRKVSRCQSLCLLCREPREPGGSGWD